MFFCCRHWKLLVLCFNCREYKRDGLNKICRIANHHADILCVPAELHMVNEAVMLEVHFFVQLFLSHSYCCSIAILQSSVPLFALHFLLPMQAWNRMH